MKRILLIFSLVLLCGMAFSITGNIHVRYCDNADGNWLSGTAYPGPEFGSYQNNPSITGNGLPDWEMWQSAPGTGFDLNFDNFGITYMTRPGFTFEGDGWNVNNAQGYFNVYSNSSPGYLRFRDVKIGNASISFGVAWWETFAFASNFGTNTNFATTNMNDNGSLIYNRVYLDLKLNIPFSDNITLKNYDWSYNYFILTAGSYFKQDLAGGTTNNQSITHFIGNLQPALVMDFNPLKLEIEPRIYVAISNVYRGDSTDPTNRGYSDYMRFGGNFRATYAINDLISPYGFVGFYYESGKTFSNTTAGTSVATNTDTTTNTMTLPFFVGVKLNLAPGIGMTIGYGLQYVLSATGNIYGPGRATTNTTTSTFFIPRSGWGNGQFGDSVNDNSFMNFQADARFAGNWEMGIGAAVSLNDRYPYNYGDSYSNMNDTALGTVNGPIYQQTAVSGSSVVTVTSKFQLLHFINQMNWQDQMFIKYEDATVAIKGTIAGNNKYLSSYSGANPLLGLFSYIDFTYKF